MKITETQRRVMCDLALAGRLTHPRGSLERLQKKGVVSGDRRRGWTLTPQGLRLVAASCYAVSNR
jgi:uncharacterized protein YjhX (UPF0386 family)